MEFFNQNLLHVEIGGNEILRNITENMVFGRGKKDKKWHPGHFNYHKT